MNQKKDVPRYPFVAVLVTVIAIIGLLASPGATGLAIAIVSLFLLAPMLLTRSNDDDNFNK